MALREGYGTGTRENKKLTKNDNVLRKEGFKSGKSAKMKNKL